MPKRYTTKSSSKPTAKNTSRRTKVNSSESMKVLIGVLLIVFVVSAVALVIWYSRQQSLIATQQKIETYLEEKYKRQFVVGIPERKASGLAVEGYLQTEAYPAEDKDLVFSVQSSSNGVTDRYPAVIWSKDQQSVVSETIKEVVPENVLSAELSIVPSNKLNKTIVGKVPSYAQILERSREELSYTVLLTGNVSKSQYEQLLKNLRTDLQPLIELMRNQNTGQSNLSIRLTIDKDGAYVCSVNGIDNISSQITNQLSECFRRV